jgi:hypothetical protein
MMLAFEKLKTVTDCHGFLVLRHTPVIAYKLLYRY